MSSLADVNTAMRERVTHLERRYGRKRVYLATGIVALLAVLLAIRVITSRQKAASPPALRAVAMANAMKADAAVAVAQVNLDYCTIRSPIDGRTSIRNVDVGNLVGPSSPPLVMVQRLDPIYTDFTIAEPDIPLVRQHLNGPPLQ